MKILFLKINKSFNENEISLENCLMPIKSFILFSICLKYCLSLIFLVYAKTPREDKTKKLF